jgi:hypothetical protein
MWLILALLITFLLSVTTYLFMGRNKNALTSQKKNKNTIKPKEEIKPEEKIQYKEDIKPKPEKIINKEEEEEKKRRREEQEKQTLLKRERQKIALKEKKEQEEKDYQIYKQEKAQKEKEEKERQRLAKIEWDAEVEKNIRERKLLEKQLDEQIKREKKSYLEQLRKEEELKEQKKKEEIQIREKKLARFKPSGVLYEPIDEKDLKKQLSIFPSGSKSLCEVMPKFKCPEEISDTRGIFPCLLEKVIELNEFVCYEIPRKKAFSILDGTSCLMQMPICRTADNWIGIPAYLETYMPAEHIVSFPMDAKPIFAVNKKYVNIENKDAILIPSYSNMLEFITLHCEISKCSGVELGFQIFGILNGEPCQNRCAVFLSLCMFGSEVVRCPRWFGTNLMILDLICSKRLTWQNIFEPRKGLGFFPPSTVEAVQNSKQPCNINLETIQEENRIIEMWLKIFLRINSDAPIKLSQPEICEILFNRLARTNFLLEK